MATMALAPSERPARSTVGRPHKERPDGASSSARAGLHSEPCDSPPLGQDQSRNDQPCAAVDVENGCTFGWNTGQAAVSENVWKRPKVGDCRSACAASAGNCSCPIGNGLSEQFTAKYESSPR